MKVVAMIPARIGSKRVPKKNLRLINGKPLISYILETIQKIDIFDEVYINADDQIFEQIATENHIKFYLRDSQFATDESTNDEFMLDFLNHINCNIVIQILPTSPLLSANEILSFTKYMIDNNLDTLISVEHKQIASIYEGSPINFDKLKRNPPSQNMKPIKAYATVLMGWKTSSFTSNMYQFGCAYHGGNGLTDYYQLKGLSTIDIDTEDDFMLAETIIKSLASNNHAQNEVKFYE